MFIYFERGVYMENDNNIKIKVGARIKFLRNEIGLTQEQLANKLPNVKGKSSIANYENGSNFPSDEVKLKMCEIFNCSLDYLMCKTDIKNYDKDEQEFRFAYHKEMEGLTEQEIADALRFYKEMKKRVGGNNGVK